MPHSKETSISTTLSSGWEQLSEVFRETPLPLIGSVFSAFCILALATHLDSLVNPIVLKCCTLAVGFFIVWIPMREILRNTIAGSQDSAGKGLSRKGVVDAFRSLSIFFTSLLVPAVGLLFFLIPGVYLLARLSFGLHFNLESNTGFARSLVLSWRQTRHHGWEVFRMLWFASFFVAIPLILFGIAFFTLYHEFRLNFLAESFLSYVAILGVVTIFLMGFLFFQFVISAFIRASSQPET